MTQTIPSGVWTRLDGYDAEVFHDSGAPITVEVVGSRLETNDDSPSRLPLRPPGGVWPEGFRVPVAGTWVYGGVPVGMRRGDGWTSWEKIEFDTEPC